MQKAIDEEVSKAMSDLQELLAEEDEEVIAVPSSLRSNFARIEEFKIPEQFIAWAKDVLTLYQDTEDAQTMDDFKTLCNNHYKKIAQ